jgi:hypothetical protein
LGAIVFVGGVLWGVLVGHFWGGEKEKRRVSSVSSLVFPYSLLPVGVVGSLDGRIAAGLLLG